MSSQELWIRAAGAFVPSAVLFEPGMGKHSKINSTDYSMQNKVFLYD